MVSLVGAVHQFKIMMPVTRKTPRNSRAHFSTLSWVIGGNDIEITDYFKSYYGLFQRVCSCNEYFPTVKEIHKLKNDYWEDKSVKKGPDKGS